MFLPPLGLRHVNDQLLWHVPSFIPWPTSGNVVRFRRPNSVDNTGDVLDTNGMFEIDNRLGADYCVVYLAGEFTALQELLPADPSFAWLTVLGQQDLGTSLTDLTAFASHPVDAKQFSGDKGAWLGDNLGSATGEPKATAPFQGHTFLNNFAQAVASVAGWPFYGDPNGSAAGRWSLAWPIGSLANPCLSVSSYRRLLVNLRIQNAVELPTASLEMQVKGAIVASLFEFPADETGLRRG